jgi:tetratricopeptide (TPR) repeat protein
MTMAWIGVAPPLAAGFIARQESGLALKDALVPGATVALVADRLGDRPGGWPTDRRGADARDWRDSSGKTQLAESYARSLWQDGAVELVIWVTATSHSSVLSGYAEAAAALEVQLAGDAETVSGRLLGWLRETARRWLVVLDDLTGTLDEGLWPAGPAGRVLVTTADPAAFAALAERRARAIPVGPYSRREALTYLIGRLAADLDQRQGAIDLVGDLDHDPLALAQASAVIGTSDLTCHDYREHFTRRMEQAVSASTGGGAGPDGDGEPAPGAITWALSMDHADLLTPRTAQSLLVLAALLDGNGIPATVFETPAAREHCAFPVAGAAATPAHALQAVRDGLAALGHAGLVSVDEALSPPLLRMSWPVLAAVRAAMPDGMRKGAAVAAADAVLQAWPADDPPTWLSRALRSCAENLRQSAGDLLWEGGCHPLLLRAGRSLDAARLTGPAVAHWAELAAASGRVLGPTHQETSGINERLAAAYLAAGQPMQAITLLRDVLRERAGAEGPDHQGTVDATRDLGLALVRAGWFSEATTVLAEAASGRDRAQGRDSIAALSAREDLAAAHRAAGQFAEAITLYRRVLTERERVQGARHADVTAVRQKLAEAYLADGQAKAAISQYERVVADRDRVLGAAHLDTIAARGALGAAYHAAGKMAAAVRLGEQTRAAYMGALGADHPDTLTACLNLAHAYAAVGRRTDAVRLLTDTVDRCELSLPVSDPLTVAARTSLTTINGPS